LKQEQGGLVRQGIYQLEDETLTLCLAPPGEKRPADFTPRPETRHALLVYRRAPEGGGKEPLAMIRNREKPIDPMPTMSPGEYEAAVAAFIRNKGITRCPTACLARTQASVPAADRAALERYEAGREQSRRESLAAVARSIGVFPTPPNAC